MKYIRTKDGIYSIEPNKMYELNDLDKGYKIADTIEELCDEFVLFRDGKPYAIVSNKEHNAELAKDVWKDYYGAIWTEKGLIYVAKINDKGELELI